MSELVCWMAVPDARAPITSQLYTALTPVEQARADRFRFARDEAAYVAAHGLLRLELGRRLGQAPEQVEIVYDPLGKPRVRVPNGAPLHFSISHSRRYVACAFSRYLVGVDIEHIDRELDLSVSRVLSGPERQYLNSVAPEDRKAAFFQIWTMKEAVLKAFGTGLSTPLDSFSVCVKTLSIRPEPGSPLPVDLQWCVTLRHLGNGSICCAVRIGRKSQVPPMNFNEGLRDESLLLS
ncbi:4'-phosphopantetheinyl transferase superfamily protein [Phaeobacter sp. B1627]|uniref:4'-phosphopantetheinyl transferase family protein n=1 Tax=Phaeobacter sp. B1627 TaxID=2583809 RepID=UPI00111963D1|nr:4'-phosphopantetheinyl transferase superfamily protein [Phaeobacter sp. B1627]TNJ42310.1 4'-phosphopantetheinyl transferase superfamily protein [Phaeobacter sp. B1627]